MDIQFTENKLIELFIEIDDLYKSYSTYRQQVGQPIKLQRPKAKAPPDGSMD